MRFARGNKEYIGETAVQVVRAIEGATSEYPNRGGTIKDFLSWSLARLADRVPLRELDVSNHLSDETLAFNYLCLLDNYDIGKLYETRSISKG